MFWLVYGGGLKHFQTQKPEQMFLVSRQPYMFSPLLTISRRFWREESLVRKQFNPYKLLHFIEYIEEYNKKYTHSFPSNQFGFKFVVSVLNSQDKTPVEPNLKWVNPTRVAACNWSTTV